MTDKPEPRWNTGLRFQIGNRRMAMLSSRKPAGRHVWRNALQRRLFMAAKGFGRIAHGG